MVFLFNRTIKNVLSNYILHEIIICDDQDPPWIKNRLKELFNEKKDTFQCYLHGNKNPKLFNKYEYLQNELKSLIEANKEKYYSRVSKRIMNPLTSNKTCWSILKSFLNNKKIPCIPALFFLFFFMNINLQLKIKKQKKTFTRDLGTWGCLGQT